MSFQYRLRDDLPQCPSCHGDLPTGGDTSMAFTLNVRKGGVNFNCLVRDCYCGLEFAVDQTKTDRWGYSFRCPHCKSYEADLPFGDRCTACYMQDIVGLYDPIALVEAVREAEPYITPTREDTLDALLHGLLRGLPGLTCEDQAA